MRADLVGAIREAVAGGVDVVHLRDPAASAAELYALGLELREIAPLIVNDRVDVALALGVDHVQLGARSLPPPVVRRIAPGLKIGVSIHGLEEVVHADWLIAGTIYPSASHPGHPGAGPGLIEALTARTSIPIVAIGGIDETNAAEVIAAGAHGVAVIRAILDAPSPRDAARRLADAIHG